MRYYIYTLGNPDTGEIRYVGKTNNISRRLYQHVKDKSKSYKHNWIKSLASKPLIEILEEYEDEKKCYKAEIYWIEQFRQWGFRLVNLSKGGEGSDAGVNHPNNKTTEAVIKSIIEDIREGNLTYLEIASKHNTTRHIVSGLKRGRIWTHLTGGRLINATSHKKSVANRVRVLTNLGLYDKLSVIVEQIDLLGNTIAVYKSVSEASRLTGIGRDNISHCISGAQLTAGGYKWSKIKKT